MTLRRTVAAGAVGAFVAACAADTSSPPRPPPVVVLAPDGPPPPVMSVKNEVPETSPREADAPGTPRSSEPIVFLPWSTDIEEDARRRRVPILIYARADWAAPCARLERDVFPDPEVRLAASQYIPVVIDVTDESVSQSELVMRMGVERMPCIKVVNVTGPSSKPVLEVGKCLSATEDPRALAEALRR